ncbi:hypothetical protein [Alkalihalobacterium alkalinitrilicum]|uniref:hypothetical protein n=1 Tax=Alkalihalobacterium alkalinitrilicum TaxID=427920 RepID=UPI000994E37C|nr:hypothetical protein [Alkalihalobacterium alkalinitrilicum]
MRDTHNDPLKSIKQFEEEWNKRLISTLNCEDFVFEAGNWIDSHLDEVIEKRKVAEFWLDVLCTPTKKNIAVLANKIIKHEQQVDFLEDQLFSLTLESRKITKILAKTKNDFHHLKNILDKEVSSKDLKIELELLKGELEELIASF